MVKKTTETPATPKKTVTKKVAKSAAPAPVVEETAPVEENTVVEEKSVIDTFGVFMKRLQELSAEFNALRKEFGVLEKATSRELKAAKKARTRCSLASTSFTPTKNINV